MSISKGDRMTVYEKLVRLCESKGELVGILPGFKGDKILYKLGRYLIMVDSEPVRPESLIVYVSDLESRRILYHSPFAEIGAVMFGISLQGSSNPKILERIVKEFERDDEKGD